MNVGEMPKGVAVMLALILLVVSAAIGSVSTFGPTWIEDDLASEAGSTPDGAQLTLGATTTITRIRGQLEGLADAPTLVGGEFDLEDMYAILIEDPTVFSATTVPELGGDADFDSRLFLFDQNGNPLLGNDDTDLSVTTLGAVISDKSTLTNTSSDGTTIIVLDPGIYFIAITVSPRVPRDANGEPLFEFESSTEVSGPDGTGGENEIVEWVPDPNGACCIATEEITVECEIVTAVQCATLSGAYLGDDSMCGACIPIGACCLDLAVALGDAQDPCLILTKAACDALAGAYQGDGSDCTTCDPVGACCLDGENGDIALTVECESINKATCDLLGGEYQGDETTCEACIPTGACCIETEDDVAFDDDDNDDVNCEILTKGECIVAGGSYQGDDSTCDACATLGACCVEYDEYASSGEESGICIITTEEDCDALGGEFENADECDEECGAPRGGACCFIDEGNSVFCGNLTEDDCHQFGGSFQGGDTACATVGCPVGACCLSGDAFSGELTCVDTTFPRECEELGGVFLGEDSRCEDDECGSNAGFGACCLGTLCVLTSNEKCIQLGGFFFGPGAPCGPATCIPAGNDTAGLEIVTGEYEILLTGVAPSGGDCDDDGLIDVIQTEPESNPAEAIVADECIDAQLIGPGFQFDGATDALTTTGTTISCGPSFPVVDGWYRYRASWTDSATLNINGPLLNFFVEVWDGCPDEDGVLIACGDVSPAGFSFDVDRGTTYYIRFAGRTMLVGSYFLSIDAPTTLLNAADLNANGEPDSCDCIEDADGNAFVDAGDVMFVMDNFGPCPPDDACPADIDGNGIVDWQDVRIVVNAPFGPCDPDAVSMTPPGTPHGVADDLVGSNSTHRRPDVQRK